MRNFTVRTTLLLIASFSTLFGQELDKPVTAVPRLVRVTGSFHPANALPVGATESATLSIYKDEQGGTPLWQETQNVVIDANGQYTAMLGITQKDGVPVDLFSATEPRWFGVLFNRPGEMEQPRVQFVSVPYALKASDAETLGGRPASAYLLDPNAPVNATANDTAGGSGSTTPTSLANSKSLKPRSITGTINYLPYFIDSSSDLGNSVLYQSGGNIAIGNTSPLNLLEVGSAALGGFTGNALVVSNLAGNSHLNVGQGPANRGRLLWGFNSTPANAYMALGVAGGTNPLILQDAGGKVGIGTLNPSPLNASAIVPKLVVAGSGGLQGLQAVRTSSPGVGGAQVIISSTRGSDAVTYTSLQNGDGIGTFSFNGTDGTQFVPAAAVESQVDGVVSTNNVPGRLLFATSTGGSNNLVERMRITSGGNVGIGTTTPGSTLDVAGDINFTGAVRFQGTPLLRLPGGIGAGNTAYGYGALTFDGSGVSNTAIGQGALFANTSGYNNTAVGSGVLNFTTTGYSNTGVGFSSLVGNTSGFGNTAVGNNTLTSNNTGNQNTALGAGALQNNIVGGNTATGYDALNANTTGYGNTAIGTTALASNTLGWSNAAMGNSALQANTSGSNNTASGYAALSGNTTGTDNTAIGFEALLNGAGSWNTAVGSQALSSGGGYSNTAMGTGALYSDTSGYFNTAFGGGALGHNTTGYQNTASGEDALYFNTTGTNNTAIGLQALLANTSGSNNIAIGYQAAQNVAQENGNNIHIGSQGEASDSGTIRIGSSFQTAIYLAGVTSNTLANGAPLVWDTMTMQLGYASSSRRYKEDVQDMRDASSGLMRLRPVTFRYKKALEDGSKPIQYGLIAEEVAEVYPDLVAHSADGQIETVKYQVLDSMLLNEVQKQQKEIGSQQEEIRQLREQNQSLQDRLARLENAMER